MRPFKGKFSICFVPSCSPIDDVVLSTRGAALVTSTVWEDEPTISFTSWRRAVSAEMEAPTI